MRSLPVTIAALGFALAAGCTRTTRTVLLVPEARRVPGLDPRGPTRPPAPAPLALLRRDRGRRARGQLDSVPAHGGPEGRARTDRG